jgi:hypothetical protein
MLDESKWGPFGVYLHGVDRQPFKGQCKFYRSERSGHQLTLRSTAEKSAVAADRTTNADLVR